MLTSKHTDRMVPINKQWLFYCIAGASLWVSLSHIVFHFVWRPPHFFQQQVNYQGIEFYFYGHIVASIIVLAIGPFQFYSPLRYRFPHLHRMLGYCYHLGVWVGGVCALVMAPQAYGGLPSSLGFITLAILWMMSSGIALWKIHQGDVQGHWHWSLRSFSLTFTAVTLRVFNVLLFWLTLGNVSASTYQLGYQSIVWGSLLLNLGVIEGYLFKQRVKSYRQKSHSLA